MPTDKGVQRRFPKRQQPQLGGLDVSASTSTSSFSISSILDPPPPYVLSRPHSSDDASAGVNNLDTLTADTPALTTSDMFTPSGTPIIFPASNSGSATPKATQSGFVSSPANPHAGPSASGVSIRKTLSSVDDILWADMRRRRNREPFLAPVGYEFEALPCQRRCDEEDDYTSADENNENTDQEDICPITEYNQDYTNLRPISTGSRGGMGETETEMDEPSSRLPTSRKITPPQRQYDSGSTSNSLLDIISGPSPTSPLSHDPSTPPLLAKLSRSRLTPLLFELFKLLSVVPAGLGFLWHLWCFVCTAWPPHDKLLDSVGFTTKETTDLSEFVVRLHSPFDHFICLLWTTVSKTLLTAHQCLALTTGLQLRWRAYYPSHATLIRLLALQAICWPATRFTLMFVNHDVRPVICWTIVGTTTCFSRAVQIWVVSNLKIVRYGMTPCRRVRGKARPPADGRSPSNGLTINTEINLSYISNITDPQTHPHDDDFTIKWVPRRWDWPLITRTCVIPAAVVYFVMAWVGELRREVGR
ncbi:hypothetical protein Clacol_008470 [Clathrus columnatus]|uniref:Uncharacterized protein n=1 Tax=Clathrus columnatus TaxID=1419009 RepID=A0AAV5AL54_9AGAM|nr:hypothetical protein Clacol_008470 [Clathrus columnatus]